MSECPDLEQPEQEWEDVPLFDPPTDPRAMTDVPF